MSEPSIVRVVGFWIVGGDITENNGWIISEKSGLKYWNGTSWVLDDILLSQYDIYPHSHRNHLIAFIMKGRLNSCELIYLLYFDTYSFLGKKGVTCGEQKMI